MTGTGIEVYVRIYSMVATSDSVLRRGMNRRATRAMTTRPSLNVTEYAYQGGGE